jgi:hypothetical protein
MAGIRKVMETGLEFSQLSVLFLFLFLFLLTVEADIRLFISIF